MAVRGDACRSRHPDRDVGAGRCSFDQTARGDAVARGSESRIVVLRPRCMLPDPEGRAPGAGVGAARVPGVEDDGVRLKFNPFANISREEIEAIYALAKLPPHPLAASGYLSVGCMPCTSRTSPDEEARAGRWRGRPKTECGIHTVKTS